MTEEFMRYLPHTVGVMQETNSSNLLKHTTAFGRSFASLFGLILALTSLKSTSLHTTYVTGLFALSGLVVLVTFGFALVAFTSHRTSSAHRKVWTAWILLFAIFFFGLIRGRDLEGLYQFGQMLFVFGLLGWTSMKRWATRDIYWFALVYSIVVLVAWWTAGVIGGFPGGLPPSNPNSVGLMAFIGVATCALGFVAKRGRLSHLVFLTMAFLYVATLLLSESRASLLALCVFITTFLLYSSLRNNLLCKLYFLGIIAFLLFFTYIMVVQTRKESSLERGLANANEAITTKKMGSREEVWTPIVDAIARHPVFGMGLGWSGADVTGQEFSEHSQYLRIGLQTGIPGIIAFVWLLYTIGAAMITSSDDYRFGRVGLSLLMGLAIHEGFEVALTGASLPIGSGAWVLLGICLSAHTCKNCR